MNQHKITFSTVEILCWLLETEPQSVRGLFWRTCQRQPDQSITVGSGTIDAGHLQRGADQGERSGVAHQLHKSGRHFAETVRRTFENSVKKYFVDPLNDDDIAAITRIWAKLENAEGPS